MTHTFLRRAINASNLHHTSCSKLGGPQGRKRQHHEIHEQEQVRR